MRSTTGAVTVVGRYLLPINPAAEAMEVCAVQPLGV
jgi:hypothetical protein